MIQLRVASDRPYHILIGGGLLKQAGARIAQVVKPCRAALITDRKTHELYADAAVRSLSDAGFELCEFVMERGENAKVMATLSSILEFLAEHRLTRGDLIVALGGGVVGDVAGFAAAVYQRGIRFAQLPTTLLAAVDSSVGGKTAVNLSAGKNLAGAFWQPSIVLCDHDTLLTLPKEIFADGMAEVIKYGMIRDARLFALISQGDCARRLEEVIAACLSIKAEVVAKDECDRAERQILNFGHTLGHAIEKLSGYAIMHGHAVAVGMVMITRAAQRMGVAAEGCLTGLIGNLEKNGLPTACDFPPEDLARAALSDKKRGGDKITLVLPEEVGRCRLESVQVSDLPGIVKLGANH